MLVGRRVHDRAANANSSGRRTARTGAAGGVAARTGHLPDALVRLNDYASDPTATEGEGPGLRGDRRDGAAALAAQFAGLRLSLYIDVSAEPRGATPCDARRRLGRASGLAVVPRRNGCAAGLRSSSSHLIGAFPASAPSSPRRPPPLPLPSPRPVPKPSAAHRTLLCLLDAADVLAAGILVRVRGAPLHTAKLRQKRFKRNYSVVAPNSRPT